MSQYDFGTIDPYVVDGVQLASMLNNWRDAIHTWHRGASRPSYIVPGQMWINDSGGATNWIVNVYLGATPGDVPVFNYNTTTGSITSPSAIVLAQAAASPSVQWNATGNPIDAKNWRMTENATGGLVLGAYTDAGVLQQSVTFNRDGTVTAGGWRTLGRVVTTAAQATVDFRTLPADINDLEFTFDVTPTATAADFNLRFYNASNALISTATHNFTATQANQAASANAPVATGFTSSGYIGLNYQVATRRINNSGTNGGIRGFGKVVNITSATRLKSVNFQSDYLSDDSTSWLFCTGGGSFNTATAVSGLQFYMNATSFAAGGVITLRGSP